MIGQMTGGSAHVQAEQAGDAFEDFNADFWVAFKDGVEAFAGKDHQSGIFPGADRGGSGDVVDDGHFADGASTGEGGDDGAFARTGHL